MAETNDDQSIREPRRRRRLAAPARALIAAIAVTLLAWALLEPFTLGVSHYAVSDPQVPEQFDGVRIAFISDVHAGPLYGRKRVAKVIDTVNAASPDLVILGGDYVGGYSGGFDAFYSEARRLNPPLGIVAVRGNHDDWEGRTRTTENLQRIGASILDNRNVRVLRNGETIIVAGVGNLSTGGAYLESAAKDIPADSYAILVSHNPDVFGEQLPQRAKAFDLALAGHLHGGQVTLFGLYAPVMPSDFGNRYRGGWRTEEGVDIFVSRGIGTVDLPVRFFAQPEVVVLDLKRGPDAVTRVRPKR